MRTYTEEDLRKAIDYACQTQRADDYDLAGQHLIVGDSELKTGAIKTLDALSDTDTHVGGTITIEEINDYIDNGWN